jgi:predicted short-subunit dehydrogenase-like oxidoreductase (DUF2520 family)
MDIAIVGAGTVGTAVAVAWARAGHRITAVAGRSATAARAAAWLPGVPVRSQVDVATGADLVVFGVPDDALPGVIAAVTPYLAPRAWVAHMSGAQGLEVLAHAAPARPLAVHPLQTFADVAGAIRALPGCTVAVTARDAEGWELGERLASDLGAASFRLADEHRPLYHAAAVFASNYLVTVAGVAEQLFAAAGVPQPAAAMQPLQRATLDNVERLGPREALTGPAVRGDAGTIDTNLRAIAEESPSLVPAYVALCRAALSIAGPRLADDGRARVEEVLTRWS